MRDKFRQMPKGGLSPFDVPTERTAANRFYAGEARQVLPELPKILCHPEDPVLSAKIRVGIDWILGRTTVLCELGRMLVEDPNPDDIKRFQDTVRYIAQGHTRMNARDAAAYARRVRIGEGGRRGRKDRLTALHHEFNVAINHHRRRFPESSWEDVLKALEHTEKQIRLKVR
jgi:hypothetical protein